MSEQEKAVELARLREYLADLESSASSASHELSAPPNKEREIARVRARIAELEADLGI